MNLQILKFILKQITPYGYRIYIIIICMLVASSIGILYPLLQREVFDNGIVASNFKIVINYTLLIILLFFTEQVLSFIQFIHFQFVNRSIPFDLMCKALEHFFKLKMKYYKDNNYLKTIHNLNNDIAIIAQVINNILMQTSLSLFKLVGGIIGLCIIDWRLAIFVVIVVPVEVIIKRFISTKKQMFFSNFIKLSEVYSILFGETFKNIEMIKLWNLREIRLNKIKSIKREIISYETKMEYTDTFSSIVTQFLSVFFTNGLNIFGAIFIMRNELSLGGLIAFISYSLYVLQPIFTLTNIFYGIRSSIPAFERYMNFFENEVEKEINGSKNLSLNDINSIIFNDVSFGYDKNEMILKSISLSINKGEKIGFVGINGSGKTTLIDLLLRSNEAFSGNIYVNNIDVNEIALKEYHQLFCVMNQSITLFDDTIKNNINVLNNLTDEQIKELLDLTTASSFIDLLPMGINSNVGYNGVNLSAGEKQKISLARTLAKDGKILILDEATANFDLVAEHEFSSYIANCTDYDIIIVVSHREEILKCLDRIYLIKDGYIYDTGSFDDLLNRGDYLLQLLTNNNLKCN